MKAWSGVQVLDGDDTASSTPAGGAATDGRMQGGGLAPPAGIEPVDVATSPLLYKPTIKNVSSGGLEIRGTESAPRSLGAKSKVNHYRKSVGL